jgi:hypothetical protein
MKKQLNSTIKAHLLRSALFLLPLLAVCVIPFALGQRQTDALSLQTDPTGLICTPGSWEAGADLPSPAVRMVGVFFPANARFYGMGGRSSEVAGSDFVHPFEYDPFANTWTPRAATYPDNEVNNMACGILIDNGTPYIYCVGGSEVATQTSTGRVFRYEPITDTISTVPANWPSGDANILPGGFTVLNNKLYILGGFRINTAMTDTIWEFTPGTNTWVLKNAVLPVSRGYIPTLAVYDFIVGTYLIYTGGGSDWNGTTLVDTNDSFKYDPIADSITTIASIPRATGETQAIPWTLSKSPQEMLVMGGGRTPPNPSNEVDVYLPFTNGWGTYGHFVTARRNFATDSNGGAPHSRGAIDLAAALPAGGRTREGSVFRVTASGEVSS